ncbi:MAG: hypothetical protein QOE21_1600 [Microbacteriaceae bacterium]|nr:hypothetical protein [Microbacteriaceae bacterium]
MATAAFVPAALRAACVRAAHLAAAAVSRAEEPPVGRAAHQAPVLLQASSPKPVARSNRAVTRQSSDRAAPGTLAYRRAPRIEVSVR